MGQRINRRRPRQARRTYDPSVEQLANDLKPAPRSVDVDRPRQRRSAGVDRHKVSDTKLDDYWDLFETVPLVREPIRAFATEVIAPGVSVEASNESDAEELESWLQDCAILNGRPNQPFEAMAKDLIVQREVRGGALVEKVPGEEDEDTLWGFKPIRVDTVNHYTRDGQSILLAPDEHTREGADVPEKLITEDGQTAAYVQWDEDIGFTKREKRLFTRDELISLVRDADTGEVFGTSRLAAVEDRINSLTSKLDDNDKAIESLAWKFWLFKMGTGDSGPWDPDDIDDFMQNHKSSDFQPGMKQAVQGDVEIDTIEGEVAEGLAEFLDFDVNWIISVMPMPKYSLGGFEENVNQFVSRSQETRLQNQLREARQEISNEFTPALKQKAEEMGLSSESVELVIEEDDPMTDFTRPPASREQDGPVDDPRNSDSPGEDREDSDSTDSPGENSVWHSRYDGVHEELGDPRFVSTREEETQIRTETREILMDVRQQVAERLRSEIPRLHGRLAEGVNIRSSGEVDTIVDGAVSSVLRRRQPQQSTAGQFQEVVRHTVDRLSEQLDGTSRGGLANQTAARVFSDDYRSTVEKAVEDMAATARTQARKGLQNGEDADLIVARFEDQFDRRTVFSRAHVIAQMEVQNAVETVRLREYSEAEDVVGVTFINPCGPATTLLCRDIACGGESVEVFFEEGDLGGQIQDQVDETNTFEGFDPMPANPPFHFGCRTESIPIFSEELEEVPDDGVSADELPVGSDPTTAGEASSD